MYFVDCPGFSDNNKNKEFPNRTIVHKIMREAKTVKICLVINYNELICRKGEYALEVMTTISRLFSDKGIESGNLIIPVINQASEMEAKITMIDHKFKRTLDFIKEKIKVVKKKEDGGDLTYEEEDILNQFNGSDFPTETELTSLCTFLEYMLKNYIVLDPVDDLEEGFAARNKTMAEVREFLTKTTGIPPADSSDGDIPYKLCNYLTE